jgi:hypothetical protein
MQDFMIVWLTDCAATHKAIWSLLHPADSYSHQQLVVPPREGNTAVDMTACCVHMRRQTCSNGCSAQRCLVH